LEPTPDPKDPTRAAFLVGFNRLISLPSQGSDSATTAIQKEVWWRNTTDNPWITPQVWVGACHELQESCKWRPTWPEIEAACQYVKTMLDEEGAANYVQAKRQQAERAQTGVENRPGRDTPKALPPAKPTEREVRRATVMRHIAIGRARQRNRNRLMAAYAKSNGLTLGATEIPESAWKGQDEPTPEQIAAVLAEPKTNQGIETLYRALRPGEKRAVQPGWQRIGPDGEDQPGEHWVDVRKPDPPSPNQQKEREKVLDKEPSFPPYNDTAFKRDHPGVNAYAEPGEYTWPKVESQDDR
jgi:hypothetical protein